jgi:flavin-dependent dehydrogenase
MLTAAFGPGDIQRPSPGPGRLRVAIVGAGPSGSALSMLLAREGAEVILFDEDRRPELLVGESLVPAVVPIFRRLGVEEEMAAFSRVKPGVSFIWSPTDRFGFTFARFAPSVFPYAYNIPRPRFDEALRSRALAAGVHHVVGRARLQPGPVDGSGAELALAPETLAAAPVLDGRQPDLIVDATGRARHAARTLGIGADLGPRKDVAHFAHFEGFHWDDAPGQVLIARGPAGWSWCIPLEDRLSVGIVLGPDDAAELGRTPEERLDRAIARDPWLRSVVGDGRRVTGVATYANYQLISQRGHGPGWVMVGDAFGFVDPMLSPGVFLALRSAELVAECLSPVIRRRTLVSPAELGSALGSYTAAQTAMLAAWQDLVAYLYDGRLAALMRSGRAFMAHGPSFVRGKAQHHIERHIGLQASGAATTSRYSRGLLRFLSRYGLRGVDPATLAIR